MLNWIVIHTMLGGTDSIPWIRQGSVRKIGDGSNVKVWTDKWIPWQPTLPNNHPSVDPEMPVRELIVNGQWDRAKLVEMFPPNLVSYILKIAVIPTEQPNKLIWSSTKMDYSVSTAPIKWSLWPIVLRQEKTHTNRLKHVWRAKVPQS